jgi:hypothetical protein
MPLKKTGRYAIKKFKNTTDGKFHAPPNKENVLQRGNGLETVLIKVELYGYHVNNVHLPS